MIHIEINRTKVHNCNINFESKRFNQAQLLNCVLTRCQQSRSFAEEKEGNLEQGSGAKLPIIAALIPLDNPNTTFLFYLSYCFTCAYK
jgi:hypothetical protein